MDRQTASPTNQDKVTIMTDNTPTTLAVVQAQMDALGTDIVALNQTMAGFLSVEMDNLGDQWQALYQLKLSLLQAA
tara:strand:- start:496 stop:723 length:228 start_codon:yes stop_codon:yes gene_type:complete